MPSQMRVSLGQGVHVSLLPQPTTSTAVLQTHVKVYVTVDDDATLGTRNLVVQFGDQMLSWSGTVEILPASTTTVPALQRLGVLLLILAMTLGMLVWARRQPR